MLTTTLFSTLVLIFCLVLIEGLKYLLSGLEFDVWARTTLDSSCLLNAGIIEMHHRAQFLPFH